MIVVEAFSFRTNDGVTVFGKKWTMDSDQQPKAVVQIAHGMAEHIDRYEDFANFLVNEGFVVYGNDHRGHGKTGETANSLGFFADQNGFDKVVGDMYQLTTVSKDDYKDVPIILVGHSMGSFLSRRYMQLYGDHIDGVILSGTGGDPGILGKLGRMIARFEMSRKGNKTKSKIMNNLTFGSYNKSFHPTRTEFDWLSRNEQEVDKYMNDPLCGGVFTSGFFFDLLTGIKLVHAPEENRKIPKDLPVLLIAGDKDPVGNNAKGVQQAADLYKALGLQDVSVKLYKDARHEILNELNKDEVYEDILAWLKPRVVQK